MRPGCAYYKISCALHELLRGSAELAITGHRRLNFRCKSTVNQYLSTLQQVRVTALVEEIDDRCEIAAACRQDIQSGPRPRTGYIPARKLTPQYLAVNPKARVPTLVHIGEAIYESYDIITGFTQDVSSLAPKAAAWLWLAGNLPAQLIEIQVQGMALELDGDGFRLSRRCSVGRVKTQVLQVLRHAIDGEFTLVFQA